MIEEDKCLPAENEPSRDERHCVWYEGEMLDRESVTDRFSFSYLISN